MTHRLRLRRSASARPAATSALRFGIAGQRQVDIVGFAVASISARWRSRLRASFEDANVSPAAPTLTMRRPGGEPTSAIIGRRAARRD